MFAGAFGSLIVAIMLAFVAFRQPKTTSTYIAKIFFYLFFLLFIILVIFSVLHTIPTPIHDPIPGT